jgi:hypothetical protein
MDLVGGWQDIYSLSRTVALTCRAGMVSLRSVFGRREPVSRDSGKVMLYLFTSNLAFDFDREVNADRHAPREDNRSTGSGRDR